MAHLVAGDWGRYGRIRLWGSVGFLVTVFSAGAWFERFGMGSFPGWTAVTLAGVEFTEEEGVCGPSVSIEMTPAPLGCAGRCTSKVSARPSLCPYTTSIVTDG